MGRENTIEYKINISGDISNFQSSIQKIQDVLGKIHLDSSIKSDFSQIFSDFDKEFTNLKNKTKNDTLKIIDEKATRESYAKVGELFENLKAKLKDKNINGSFLDKDFELIKKLESEAEKYTKALNASSKLKEINQQYDAQLKLLRDIEQRQNTLNKKAVGQTNTVDSYKSQLNIINDLVQKDAARVAAWEKLAEATKNVESAEARAKATQAENKNTTRGWNFNAEYIQAAKDYANAQQEATRTEQEFQNVAQQTSVTLDTAATEQERLSSKLSSAETALHDTQSELTNLNSKYNESREAIKGFEEQIKNLKSDQFAQIKQDLDKIDWSKFGFSSAPAINSFEELKRTLEGVSNKSTTLASELLNQLKPSLDSAGQAGKGIKSGLDEASASMKKMSAMQSDIDRLTQRLVHFFSIDNAIRLFKRAVKSAVNTIKDLDKVMTQTAVVTDFTIKDMWRSLPEYTKRANELGLAVKDVYEASTLYYQQGLKTNEVMAVTNATLRMARIAGLDAADATDRMTNALRGFNMEINEMNADNVSDVYSKLAAMSASNVDEISTAMTKVASLANSANMSFENTAAFLSQIIETTRESAETAGTALKTVVARFSEVKELYSKGELLGETEEGEEIDVNKVSTALRTAGINLNEFLTGQKGLDEIFMELASKWDDLDIVQQRYIATMAAGSRQQSRFIALMSDYKRTQELTSAAQNASGASLSQYEKTLESVETKVNKLKNAWNEFLMGIANDSAVRGFLDILIKILNGINKLTNGISGGNGLLKSIANIGVAIGGLKLGKSLVTMLLGNPQAGIKGWVGKALLGLKGATTTRTLENIGQNWGTTLVGGISAKIGNAKHLFNRTFKSVVSAGDLGLQQIDFKSVSYKLNPHMMQSTFNTALSNVNLSALTENQQGVFEKLKTQLDSGQIGMTKFYTEAKKAGIQMNITGEQADQLGLKFKNQQQVLNTTRAACMGIGVTFMALGGIIDKIAGKSTLAGKLFKTMGVGLMAVGAILPVVSAAFKKFGVDVSTTIMSIPIIGWIAAIITAIIALVTVLVNVIDTPAKAAKRAEETLNAATEAANEAKEAVDNLKSSYESLAESSQKLDDLVTGTKEWTKAVRENNQEILGLLNTYKELKVTNEGGVLKITNYDEVMAQYEQRSLYASMAEVGAGINQVHERASNYTPKNYLDVLVTSGSEAVSLTDEQAKQVAMAAAEGVIQNNSDLAKYLSENLHLDGYVYGSGILDLDKLVEEGQKLLEVESDLDNLGITLGSLTNSMANLDKSSQKYAENFLNNGQRFTELYKDERFKLDRNTLWREEHWDDDSSIRDDYMQFLKETYGVTKLTNNSRGTFEFVNSEGNTERKQFKDADIQNAFATWRAAQKAADQLEQYTKAMSSLTETQQRVFEGTKGENLTFNDLKELAGGKDVFNLTPEDVKGLAEELYNLNPEGFGDKDAFLFEFAESYQGALQAYKDAGVTSEQDKLHKFSAGMASSFNSAFRSMAYHPGEFTNEFFNTLEKTDIGEDIEKQEKVIKALSTMDLSSAKDIEHFSDVLEGMGVIVDETSTEWQNFINFLINETGALNKIDLKSFKENVTDIKKTISELQSGEHGTLFTQEEYDKIRPYINEADFQETDYGVFYVGDDFENLGQSIQTAIGEGFATVNKILENKIRLNDVLEEAKQAGEVAAAAATKTTSNSLNSGLITSLNEQGISIDDYVNEQAEKARLQATINGVLQAYGDEINTLEIPELINLDDKAMTLMGVQELQELFDKIQEEALKKGVYEDEQVNVGIAEKVENGIEGLATNWTGNNSDVAALQQLISQFGLSSELQTMLTSNVTNEQDVLSNYDAAAALAQADKEGLNLEEITNFADMLVKTKDLSLGLATEVAIANTKLNQGVANLISSYEDWSDLLGESGPLGKGMEKLTMQDSEQAKSFKELKKNLSQALNVETELSDQFFADAENMQALESLMNGTAEEKTEALERLQKAAAIDFLDPAMKQYDELVALINNLDIPEMEVGATLEDGPFLSALEEMCLLAGDAADELMEALGFETEDYIKDYKTITYYTQRGNEPPEPYDVEIPIWGTRIKRKGGANWSSLNNSNKTTTGRKDSGSNGSAGSGKESKDKQWKNPYDELYNLQQKINTALRERELLEHRYEDMLKDHTKTSADLVENTLKETASLKQQLQLQKQMLAGRKSQVQNVLNEMYEDSEGNRKTLGAMGVGRYASYDLSSGLIQIDYDSINQIVDENLGKAVEQYVSRLEELQGQINDTEDTIEDISDELIELRERGKEEYLDFEQTVYDAIVSSREKEIEALEEINSSIADAASKTITAIQDEISKEREARENEQAEQNILDKEMRLAYLQRDTSGANGLEIMKLQKEIETDQQSYQDQIIDQTIQEMQDEADRAEQQRQAQIDLLNAQLEWDKENGQIWDEVRTKLQGGFNEDGSLNVNTDLYRLLQEDQNFNSLSTFGQLQWKEDLAKQIAIALQGRQNYEMEAARNAGTMTLANGTRLTYDAKQDKWFDANGNEYTDLRYDMNAQAFTGTYNAKPAPQTTPGSTEEPKKIVQNGETGAVGRITNTYGWVNVRSSVAYGNNVIGHTEKGQSFDVLGFGDYGWYMIKLPNGQIGYTAVHLNGTPLYSYTAYKSGGLADFTGPAWLDGSKSRPEMVLNAADTQNFIALKNILSSILNNTQSGNKVSGGDNYFDIDINADIGSDYDVDQLASRIKKEIYDAAAYRNVNAISTMR